jgi:putative sigma-54 modulation protein
MQLLVRGKNVDVSDAMRTHVEKKLGRLDRYLDAVSQTEVEISLEKTKAASDRYAVQVTMLANGNIIRGEERAQDVPSAVDAVVDVLQRRLVGFKEKHSRRSRTTAKEALAEALITSSADDNAEIGEVQEVQVARIKRVAIKPMSVDEAAEQMELLGHDFFLFYNAASNLTSVIYRRRTGDYGLIEAELGA